MGRARAQWLQPPGLSGFESWLRCVLAVWPQASYLPSLGLFPHLSSGVNDSTWCTGLLWSLSEGCVQCFTHLRSFITKDTLGL